MKQRIAILRFYSTGNEKAVNRVRCKYLNTLVSVLRDLCYSAPGVHVASYYNALPAYFHDNEKSDAKSCGMECI